MTASVVISNLLYLIGAVVLAVIVATIVVLRHRKPMSVEANMKTFNRGLQALAPDEQAAKRRTVLPGAATGVSTERVRILSRSGAIAEAAEEPANGAPAPRAASTEAEAG